MEESEIQSKKEDEAVEDETNTQKDGGHAEVDVNMDTVESENLETMNQIVWSIQDSRMCIIL